MKWLLDRWAALRRQRTPTPAAAATDAAPAPAVGQVFGAYGIEQLIGRGASGSVYRAVDARSGQRVALKVFRRPLVPAQPGAAREQFLRETEAARRLDHPDIAGILDAGETCGMAWLAMTLAPGRDLQVHVPAAQRLPVPDVLEIGARVAAALAHAHRQGVVHRDVKPANIIVDRSDGTPRRVSLTDFGVARIAQVAGADARAGTRSGLLLGTVAYMPPELLAGLPAEAASDLYALGATLYQLLCGHLPHEAATLAQQMHAITHSPAPDLRTWRPDAGDTLAALLRQLLAKAPGERGSDGDLLAAQLRALAAQSVG